MKIRLFVFASLLLLMFGNSALAQNWGAGIRLGDPTGISVKRYLGGSALEFNIGRSYLFYNNGRYGTKFYDWYQKKNFDYFDYQFVGYRRYAPISMQVHYLIQKDLGNALNLGVDGLDWYFGGGVQVRVQNYSYDYRYRVDGVSGWVYTEGERVTDLDLGIDGVLGLEYNFEEVPISIFLDGTLFMELVDNPLFFWGQAGLGVRYRF